MKPENLMFVHSGCGVTVCDRNRTRGGDYMTVAHIAYRSAVIYYMYALSDVAKIEIEEFAKWGNMAVSVCSPGVFALRPVHVRENIT